jgi:hypothetical protein
VTRFYATDRRERWPFILAAALIAFVLGLVVRDCLGQDVKRTPTVADALSWQQADLANLPADAQANALYIWCPDWMVKDASHVVSFAINSTASRSSSMQLPAVLHGGRLLRWDLRRLAPKAEDRKAVAAVLAALYASEPYRGSGAVVRADWMLARMLTTVEGGVYYDLSGIEKKPTRGTAQDAFLASVGANEQLVRSLDADVRVALFRSSITGKPRRVDVFVGVGSRESIGLVTITHDVTDEERRAAGHPVKNLLAFIDAGREVIVHRNNGLLAYALFNNAGALVDSVPDNIAADHEVPKGHTTRLQAAVSCIRCHGPAGGYQPLRNDVRGLVRRGLVISDQTSKDLAADLDRLAGLYSGTPDKQLFRAMSDYADAVARATSARFDGKTIAEAVSTTYGTYRYSDVDAVVACRELGYEVQGGFALNMLRQLIELPDPPAGTVVLDDPIILAMLDGKSVTRSDWESIYATAAQRVATNQKGE